jgi:hypothetical protein
VEVGNVLRKGECEDGRDRWVMEEGMLKMEGRGGRLCVVPEGMSVVVAG